MKGGDRRVSRKLEMPVNASITDGIDKSAAACESLFIENRPRRSMIDWLQLVRGRGPGGAPTPSHSAAIKILLLPSPGGSFPDSYYPTLRISKHSNYEIARLPVANFPPH